MNSPYEKNNSGSDRLEILNKFQTLTPEQQLVILNTYVSAEGIREINRISLGEKTKDNSQQVVQSMHTKYEGIINNHGANIPMNESIGSLEKVTNEIISAMKSFIKTKDRGYCRGDEMHDAIIKRFSGSNLQFSTWNKSLKREDKSIEWSILRVDDMKSGVSALFVTKGQKLPEEIKQCFDSIYGPNSLDDRTDEPIEPALVKFASNGEFTVIQKGKISWKDYHT